MADHSTGTREDHLQARLRLLQAEKEHSRRSDELATMRRALPWVRLDKQYLFLTSEGEKSLADLFDGRSQLLVYHFMFGPDWTEGCPICSFWADNFNGGLVHLRQRDVTMVCASRGRLERIEAYKQRMGWSFPWVSTVGDDFNADFGVSFGPAGPSQPEMPRGPGAVPDDAIYNFTHKPRGPENPGMSAFALDQGVVYHTYSCYERGLDALNATYQLLDRAPLGRAEEGLPFPLGWLRRHDEYGAAKPPASHAAR